jgi:hypothetical protein
MRNVCPYHGVVVAAFRMAVLHLMSQEIDVVNRRQTGWYFCDCLLHVPPGLMCTVPTFRPHAVFMCFVWISEQTAIISLYSINWQVFINEMECVYCSVRTEYLCTIQFNCERHCLLIPLCCNFSIPQNLLWLQYYTFLFIVSCSNRNFFAVIRVSASRERCSTAICTVMQHVQECNMYSTTISTVMQHVQYCNMYSDATCTVLQYVQWCNMYSSAICTVLQ